MPAQSLWPDDIITADVVRSPMTVLREQAAELGQRTKNLVEATVGRINLDADPNLLEYAFYIEAPTLSYRFQLFRVAYALVNPRQRM